MMGVDKDLFLRIVSLVFILVITFLIYNIITHKEIIRDYDCYIEHVKECQYCHENNLTYLLCSGFCVKPNEDDLDTRNRCLSIHPIENCWELPKECNF